LKFLDVIQWSEFSGDRNVQVAFRKLAKVGFVIQYGRESSINAFFTILMGWHIPAGASAGLG